VSVSAGTEDGLTYVGSTGKYEITLLKLGSENPTDCVTSGCHGIIKDLKTGKSELMGFYCNVPDNIAILHCVRVVDQELLLQKAKDGYRVDLCSSTPEYHYYYTVRLDECSGCTCILHSSNPEYSDLKYNCLLENEKLHCFGLQRYEEENFFTYKDGDFENCVGLGL